MMMVNQHNDDDGDNDDNDDDVDDHLYDNCYDQEGTWERVRQRKVLFHERDRCLVYILIIIIMMS